MEDERQASKKHEPDALLCQHNTTAAKVVKRFPAFFRKYFFQSQGAVARAASLNWQLKPAGAQGKPAALRAGWDKAAANPCRT